jgi:hypothetical protein
MDYKIPFGESFMVRSQRTSLHWQAVTIRVPSLPEALRGLLTTVLAKQQTEQDLFKPLDPPGSKASDLGAFARAPRIGPSLEERAVLDVEFTGSHQLVDGGVTDNVPLEEALHVWAFNKKTRNKEFDTVFVLTTGVPDVSQISAEEFIGGVSIGGQALERLWEKYQEKATSFDLLVPSIIFYAEDVKKWIDAARAWKRELDTKLSGLSAESREKIDSPTASPFPNWEPLLLNDDLISYDRVRGPLPAIYLVHPRESIFTQSLEVDPQKIRQAMHHGCQVTAQLFQRRAKPRANVYGTGYLILDPQSSCDALKP